MAKAYKASRQNAVDRLNKVENSSLQHSEEFAKARKLAPAAAEHLSATKERRAEREAGKSRERPWEGIPKESRQFAKAARDRSDDARQRSTQAKESFLRHTHDLAGMRNVATDAAENERRTRWNFND